jgi:hypothetical protein
MSARRDDVEDSAEMEAAVQAGHEVDSVSRSVLWRTGAAFVLIAAIGWAVIYLIQPVMVARQEEQSPAPNPLSKTYGRVEPPSPRLQVDPALDIHEHRKAEETLLTTYGWVDQQAGVVRIPIDRAMALLAERDASAAGKKAAPPDVPRGRP